MHGWGTAEPGADAVRVWLIPSDLPVPVLGDLETVLDEGERRRADAFAHPVDRRRFVAAHGAARLILARLLLAPVEEIRWRHGPHGKPELTGAGAGLHTSLSHSGDLAALAIARGRRVGVDVQRLGSMLDAVRLSARYYPEGEARFVAAARSVAGQVDRFVRLWARKEACVKATGGRLAQGLKLPVRGSGRSGGAARSAAEILVHDPDGPLPGPYLVRDVPAPPGFRACVALEGAEGYRVSRRRWSAA